MNVMVDGHDAECMINEGLFIFFMVAAGAMIVALVALAIFNM